MAGQRPIDRYNDGFKIGSSSDSQRPLSSQDLVIVEDVSENTAAESVRVARIADLFIDMTGGASGLTKNITVETTGGRYIMEFVNGVLVAYRSDNGTGTIDDPYQISTAMQLDTVRNDVNAYYVQTADIALTGYQSGEGWVPIGTYETPFAGVYDGGGYKVTGLVSAPNTGNAGLFGTLSGATITDLIVESGDVTSADGYAGVLAARSITTSTISGCIVSGVASGVMGTGGLSGQYYGTITNCGADVDVTGTGTGLIGGLVGYIGGSISKCYALGTVTGAGTRAGGLAGQAYAGTTITNSYARGAVSATTFTASGGLVGTISTSTETITYCYSCGAVTNGTINNGLIGKDESPFPDPVLGSCLWDITVNAGFTTPNLGCDGYTTAEMQSDDRYLACGFDFANIWATPTAEYPHLLWEE